MNEKPTAFLVAALVVAPLCAACILGPVVLGSMIAGLWGWFSGNGSLVAIAVIIVATALVYAVEHRRHRGAGVREKAGRDGIKTNEGNADGQ